MTNHTPEDCQSIFVSWRWLIAVLATLIATVGTMAWQGGAKLNSVDTSIRSLSDDVDHLRVMSKDLDSLKMWTRK